jgi:putative addiction module component (TIGR02574 family)
VDVLWDNAGMGKVALDLKRLSRDEQLDLLDQLWESLGRDPEAFPLTDSQREELDRRLDELEMEGPTGLSWGEVVEQVRAHSR